MNTLSFRRRVTVLERYLTGASVREIENATGVNKNTVDRHVELAFESATRILYRSRSPRSKRAGVVTVSGFVGKRSCERNIYPIVDEMSLAVVALGFGEGWHESLGDAVGPGVLTGPMVLPELVTLLTPGPYAFSKTERQQVGRSTILSVFWNYCLPREEKTPAMRFGTARHVWTVRKLAGALWGVEEDEVAREEARQAAPVPKRRSFVCSDADWGLYERAAVKSGISVEDWVRSVLGGAVALGSGGFLEAARVEERVIVAQRDVERLMEERDRLLSEARAGVEEREALTTALDAFIKKIGHRGRTK